MVATRIEAQADQFNHDVELVGSDVPMRCCTECDKELPSVESVFELLTHSNGNSYFRNQCRVCRNAIQRKRSEKARQIRHVTVTKPPRGTPEQCGSCGTTRGNIFGDVDHSTLEKYGYLCGKCYQLVRDFQGDSNRIRNVLSYVEQTRLSRV